MAISETSNIKNNKDLTQHFLYTYSHVNKIGPRETTRLQFNEDLIFDRSRKSIFTQSQEFGYISDTVYTLSLGNEINNGRTYVTLRSYEGNIEFYNYTPVKITGVAWNESLDISEKYEDTYCYNLSKFKTTYLYVSYIGSGKITSCTLSVNGETIEVKNPKIRYNQVEIDEELSFNNYLKRGKNEITISLYSSYTTYFNTEQDIQHGHTIVGTITYNIFRRFEEFEQTSIDSYTTYIYTANPIAIVKTNASYWDIVRTPDLLTVDNIVDKRLSNDYYSSFHDDHHICDNKTNETLSLLVPNDMENRDKIYGFVGGTSTEFYNMHQIDYYGEKYNFYTSPGHNWEGLDLWFQKKTLRKT